MAKHRITGSDFYCWVRCPAKVRYKWFLDPQIHANPIPPFARNLMERGNEFETLVMSKIPHLEIKSRDIPDREADLIDRSLQTKAAMIKGEKLIYQGVLWVPDGNLVLAGTPDLMRRVPGKSFFGNYHYEILDIKSAKKLKDEHIAQVVFYSLLIGKVQNKYPLRSWIINREERYIPIDNQQYRDWVEKQVLVDLKQIWFRRSKPIGFPFDFCTLCQWRKYCQKQAQQRHCVSLLPHVGKKVARELIKSGFNSLGDIYRAKDKDLLAVKGVGPVYCKTWKLMVRAYTEKVSLVLVTDEIIKRIKSDISGKDFQIILDFEGDIDSNRVYMAGLLVWSKHKKWIDRIFAPLICKENSFFGYAWCYAKINVLRNVFRKFKGLPLVKMFRKQMVEVIQYQGNEKELWRKLSLFFARYSAKKYVVIHYNSYETTVLRRMEETYGKSGGNNSQIRDVLKNLCDIYNKYYKKISFPKTLKRSLKVLAFDLCGFEWRSERIEAEYRMKNFDGADSTILYQQYLESGDKRILHDISQYNEDDLFATHSLSGFLQQLPQISPKTSGVRVIKE